MVRRSGCAGAAPSLPPLCRQSGKEIETGSRENDHDSSTASTAELGCGLACPRCRGSRGGTGGDDGVDADHGADAFAHGLKRRDENLREADDGGVSNGNEAKSALDSAREPSIRARERLCMFHVTGDFPRHF